MKTRLPALLIGVFLAGNYAVAIAGPGNARGHDRPHAEHSQQRHVDNKHWRKDRVHSRGRHQARRDDHDPHWNKGGRHGRDYARSRHDRRYWSKHRHYRHYDRYRAPHSRGYSHYKGHGHARHHYRHAPHSNLSIILHGRF